MIYAASSMIAANRAKKTTRKMTTGIALVVASCCCALGVLASPSTARADSGTQAESLFREGRTLLDAKRYDEACPKLAESQKLEPGAGTLLALAMCHEGQGKTATASAELKQASELGRRVGRTDLATAADKRARALEASVPHLVIRLPEQQHQQYRVRCDGQPVTAAEIGTPLAMDPGEHRVEVAADMKMTRSYVVRLSGAGLVEIVVEKLDDNVAAAPAAAPIVITKPKVAPAAAPLVVAAPAAPADPNERPENRGGGQRTLGLVIAGAGVVAIGAGAYFGGRAISQSSEASRACPTVADCPDGENEARDRSKDSFRISVINLAAGTGAIALGTVIYFLAPSGPAPAARVDASPTRKNKPTARLVPVGGPTQVGLGLSGSF